MGYVTQQYYTGTFLGETVDGAEFPSLLERASEIIEEMTMYRLTPVTFEAMPEWVQDRVKKAICAQIEYLDANGGSDVDNSTALQSATLGKFSYTQVAEATGGGSGSQVCYAPRAQRILAPTGLLYRGGGCY